MGQLMRYATQESFESLAHELIALVTSCGVEVKLYKRSQADLSPSGEVLGFTVEQGVEGEYHIDQKLIEVYYDEDSADRDVLYVLAHEVRHALHHTGGMFADYYSLEYSEQNRILLNGYKLPQEVIKRPCNNTAYLAELECNIWAADWLVKHGFDIPQSLNYPYKKTAAYKNNKLLDRLGYN